MSYQHAVEIYKGIWLGDVRASEDKTFLDKNNITVIVNITRDLPNLFENDGGYGSRIKYFRVSANDFNMDKEERYKNNEINNFHTQSKKIIDEVALLYNSGRNILVHCVLAQQRSPTFMILLLMKLGVSRKDAYEMVLSKKKDVFKGGREIHFLQVINNFR